MRHNDFSPVAPSEPSNKCNPIYDRTMPISQSNKSIQKVQHAFAIWCTTDWTPKGSLGLLGTPRDSRPQTTRFGIKFLDAAWEPTCWD